MAQTGANGSGAPAVPAAPVPIFLSASHHREVFFGHEVVPAPTMLAELRQRRKVAEERAARKAKGLAPAPPKSSAKRSGKVTAVSLKELLDTGVLKAGKSTITVTYKGTIYRASLLSTAQIDYNGQLFDAPSTFSMYVKRLQTPTKQGDDGWRSVHVDGVSLDEYRQRYATQKAAAEAAAAPPPAAPADGAAVDGAAAEKPADGSEKPADGEEKPADGAALAEGAAPAADGAAPAGDAAAASAEAAAAEEEAKAPDTPPIVCIYHRQLGADELPPLPSAFDVLMPKEAAPDAAAEGAEEEAGEEEPDTNNWVQCSRCQAWRVVPDEFWPDIDAANEEDWYCEEATWDLTQYDPFTKSCKEYGPGL